MNSNETKTLWLSILFALIAAFLLNSYTTEKEMQIAKKYSEKINIVVAKDDINEMETIDETMLDTIEMPKEFVQPGFIKDSLDIVGKVAIAPIRKGEQILNSKVLNPGPETGLSIKVAPTKRAVTIPVDEVRGVGKLLKPGDRIDIITALDIGSGQNKERVIKTLLKDVTILATGMSVAYEPPRVHEKVGDTDFVKNLRSYTNFDTVTVEVEPTDAQKLIYVLSTNPSSMFFSLRNPHDNEKRPLPDVRLNDLLGLSSRSAVGGQVRRPSNVSRPRGR